MKLTPAQNKEWRLYIRELKKQLPTQYPLTVKSQRMSKNSGIAFFDGSRLTIVIGTNASWVEKRDSLIHEYAHCLDPKTIGAKELHPDSWGTRLAQVYRVVEQLIKE